MSALRMLVPLVLRVLGQLVRISTWRSKFGVERPSVLSGLDDQDGLPKFFLHRDAKGELRSDLSA